MHPVRKEGNRDLETLRPGRDQKRAPGGERGSRRETSKRALSKFMMDVLEGFEKKREREKTRMKMKEMRKRKDEESSQKFEKRERKREVEETEREDV